MKKYFSLIILTAVVVAVGVVSVNFARASKSGGRALQQAKSDAAIKASQAREQSKHDTQVAARTAKDAILNANSLEQGKNNELDRLDKELKKINAQNQRLSSLSASNNPNDAKSLSTLQGITKNNASLTTELNALKTKIQADTTLDELDTDSNTLTDLIAPAKQ